MTRVRQKHFEQSKDKRLLSSDWPNTKFYVIFLFSTAVLEPLLLLQKQKFVISYYKHHEMYYYQWIQYKPAKYYFTICRGVSKHLHKLEGYGWKIIHTHTFLTYRFGKTLSQSALNLHSFYALCTLECFYISLMHH